MYCQVPLAGDSVAAKQEVRQLLDTLGYHPQDLGQLARARDIENIPLSLFTNWRRPLTLSTLIWLFIYFLYFARYHLCGPGNTWGWFPSGIENVFSMYINKTCDNHALVLLALCYLPSESGLCPFMGFVRLCPAQVTWLPTCSWLAAPSTPSSPGGWTPG